MTGLAPEVSALVISLGLVLSLVCYLVTNLSPGGMITPGWLALAFIVQPLLALLIIAVVIATYLVCQWLQSVAILYGKRLFATVVLVAVFFQLTAFIFIVQKSSVFYDATTLGFIVPGLVAYQLIRQPVVATITATATVTMVAYCIMLAGILLRMVPIEGRAAANGIAASPGAPVSSLHLVVGGLGFVLVLTVIGGQTRRVRSAGEADPDEIVVPRRRQGSRPLAGLGRVLSAGPRLIFAALTSLARHAQSGAGHAAVGARYAAVGLGRALQSVARSIASVVTMFGRSVARGVILLALWALRSATAVAAQFERAVSKGPRFALQHVRSLSMSVMSKRARAQSVASRIGPIITPSGPVALSAGKEIPPGPSSIRLSVRSYVGLTRRHREAVIILASIAAGFVIHFGLGRSETPAPRHQPTRTLISQAATYPSAPGHGLTASPRRTHSKPSDQARPGNKKPSHTKRITRVRAANLSVTSAAGGTSVPTSAPVSIPSSESAGATPTAPQMQFAPAKTPSTGPRKFDDSG
jgi:poly-gamma-glutamate biosynthesis protein PgsC/CapC